MPPASSVGDDHAALQQAPTDSHIGFQDLYHPILVSTIVLQWGMKLQSAVLLQGIKIDQQGMLK